MTNRTTPYGSRYTGWFKNEAAATPSLDMYYKGTKVGHITAAELQVDQALDVDGAANFAAEAEFVANVDFQLTVEAGGVGTDAQQFTSGGAGVVCNWDAS